MTTQTEFEMKKRRLRTLEQRLVEAALELGEFTESASFCVPFTANNGRRHFVVVGPHNAIQGLIAQARKQV